MCGIAGFYTAHSSLDPRVQPYFSKTLSHRGPDGEGIFLTETSSQHTLLLFHRRLSIIDLAQGKQPLLGENATRKAALVLNGEIYNHLSLRQHYSSYSFKTSSDGEPLLPLYFEKGESFLENIRGMYGLALYDIETDDLILARDPFGIKPLYYRTDVEGFAFASEINALIFPWMSHPSLQKEVQDQVLNLQFSCGRETLFSGIYRVLPGEILIIREGKIRKRGFLDALDYHHSREDLDVKDALEAFEKTLLETLDTHLMADVPVGIFYSKGVDSSVLLKGLNLLGHQNLKAFHLAFEGDRSSPQDASFPLKASFEEIFFQEEDFWRLLPLAAFVMDDFAADYACLPTLKLAEAAKEQGLKIILSGEGGDEIFAGYGRYKKAVRPRLFGGRSLREKSLVGGTGILKDHQGWRASFEATEKEIASFKALSLLQKAQALDLKDWLPHDLMVKLDRTLMYFGIEGRPPFLDKSLANFGFFLKDNLKLRHQHGKWILKKWLSSRCPPLNFFEKKRGFTPPIGLWLSRQARFLGEVLVDQEALKGLCNPEEVKHLFQRMSKNQHSKNEEHAAWIILFYTFWYKLHVEKISLHEDSFEMLRET